MKMDGWVRIGTMIDLDGLKKGLGKVKNTLSSVVGGLAKSLGGALSVLLVGAVATGIYILNKALEKANGESGQLKANLSYIGFVGGKVFENLLTPAINKTTGAVEGLVGALYKVVVYIGYILSEWTGKDLFEGTSVEDYQKAMEKAEKSAKGTAKSTAKIKKDLMSFDEINKLSDNTSGGGSGSGGGITMPNLPNLGDVPIPGWVDWIAKHRDDILKIATAIGGMFLIIKGLDLANKLSPLLQLFGFGGGTGGGISANALLMTGAIATIVWSISDCNKQIKETQKQVKEINKNGLKANEKWVESTEDLNALNQELNNKRKQGKDVLNELNRINNKDKIVLGDKLAVYKALSNTIKDIEKTSANYNDTIRNNLKMQDNILQAQIEQYRQGKLTKEQEEELKLTLMEQRDYIKDITLEFDNQGEDTKYLVELNRGYKSVLQEMGVEFKKNTTFVQEEEKSWRELNELAHRNENSQKGIFEMINASLKATQKLADIKLADKEFKIKVDKTGITNLIKNLPNTINLGFGVSFDTSKIKKAFGLAQGGIINNPGRGVPLGANLIGGESGREAVIPLNDETMDRLGSSIAKHMSVNLTNINQMNGRVISRELKQISNENDFGYNG